MTTFNLKIKQLFFKNDFKLPAYATKDSAGLDLSAAIEDDIIMKPGSIAVIPAGIAIGLQPGYEAQIRSRSGLAAKNGIAVLNAPGTIDADYTGEIKVILKNHSEETFVITPNMRMAQMVIAPYMVATFDVVDDLTPTARGNNGFGSTGL
jgi:dUTP pyrophosphatase